jgi:hypothetical protein
VSTIIITFDSKEPDRLVAGTVRAMRRGRDVAVAELATTSAARHDIAVALSWHRRARTTSARS